MAKKTHHLDRHAAAITRDFEAAATDNALDLFNTTQLASALRVSQTWLEIGRCKGYGPPYVKIGPRAVRYHKADVLSWLKSRTRAAAKQG